MSRVACFMVQQTEVGERRLRRLVFSKDRPESPCPRPGCFHDATVVVDPTMPWPQEDAEFAGRGRFPTEEEKSDPRWPKSCRCGYVFQASDPWYVDTERFYQRADGQGGSFRLRDAPPGSVYNATWFAEVADWRGPDGLSLCVVLPDGVAWHVDGPASNGGRWTRSGVPPVLTVKPSIKSPGYHGYLNVGVLESCADSTC